ncbi:MAG TPA: WbqC family protein [Ignavibacteria bacterium]|nr:WbqC family protein [Ignavibacteria bacterium]HMQ99168.1 WbqC family protein [Ignavibacteria bacterium]
MICTIHQPNYLPYLGFFEKAYNSDIFVLYDTTQFKKNDWQNRNKLCIPNGWQWISMPILHDFGQKILEVKIKDPEKNLAKNWRSIKVIYGRAPFFKDYSPAFEEIYNSQKQYVADLNISIIKAAAEHLGLKTKFIKSSELPEITSTSTQALIDITKHVNADTYISGAEGINYLDMDLWNSTGLKIIFQKYTHPRYKQFNSPEFQPYMNILDLLFNCGPESLDILLGKIRKQD